MRDKQGTRAKKYPEPAQEWGFLVRKLRESLPGKYSRTRFLFRYHTLLEGFDPKGFSRHELPDHWLARAERGESVKPTRIQIELLCKAGNATEEQRWEILTAAKFDPFADINGETTAVGEFCNRVTRLITRSKKARAIAQRSPSGEALTQAMLIQMLQQIVQTELEDVDKAKEVSSYLIPKPAFK